MRPSGSFALDRPHGDLLDPRRIVRWVYVGRLSVASAIFLAAVFAWLRTASTNTLIASLTFVAAMIFTVGSAIWSEVWQRPLGRTFLYLQSLFDLLLVTAVVHVTGGSASQFAALYVLVIATSALLLPIGSGLLVALLGCVLYFADALLPLEDWTNGAVAMQLGVFAIVAVGSGVIGERLRRAGMGTQALAAELARARLHAADILRNLDTGVLTVDGAGRLLYANPAAGRLLGLRLEGMLGRPVIEPIAERSAVVAEALERTIRDRSRVHRAEGAVTGEERVFPVGVTTTFAEAPGNADALSTTAIFQDISAQKRMELLRLRAQRLGAVAELSASLAHEIKNPLAAIRSSAEQLARDPIISAQGDDARVLLGLVVRESDRLSRLLSEFLDFARVRTARSEPVDLVALLEHVANLVRSHPARHEGIAVRCDLPEGPIVIQGDDDLLHRAVFNLALNAVQAIGEGTGAVRIHLAEPDPSLLPEGLTGGGDAIAIGVADDGPGIAPEIRERLFEPFATTKPQGSGLGLSVVHRAVEAHRGLVTVDGDERGGGTRFTIVLPRRQTEPGDVT